MVGELVWHCICYRIDDSKLIRAKKNEQIELNQQQQTDRNDCTNDQLYTNSKLKHSISKKI